MSDKLFNNLVKLGNQNPQLRDDISPLLHHLKGQEKKAQTGRDDVWALMYDDPRDHGDAVMSATLHPLPSISDWPQRMIENNRRASKQAAVVLFKDVSGDIVEKVEEKMEKARSSFGEDPFDAYRKLRQNSKDMEVFDVDDPEKVWT